MRTAGVGPLPTRLLSFTNADGEFVPTWLSERDRPWLRELLFDAESFDGRPIDAWIARCRGSDPDPRAGCRQAVAIHVLSQWMRRNTLSRPRTGLRRELFLLIAQGVRRDEALAKVASHHDLPAGDIEAHLFDDLPDHRLVRWPDPGPDPSQLAWASNRALVQGLLLHADSAEIRFRGAARTILRTIWLLGGSLSAVHTSADDAVVTWRRADRPHAARALSAVVPLLPWAQRYLLRARCTVGGKHGLLVLASGDPILPGPEPKRYDSALEERFAREFAALAPHWQLLREPRPLALGDTLAFPDFELRRRDGASSWLCEITGLREPDALPRKLELLSSDQPLVLCLPARLVPIALRDHPRIVTFGRHVDASAVLAVIDRHEGAGDARPRGAGFTR